MERIGHVFRMEDHRMTSCSIRMDGRSRREKGNNPVLEKITEGRKH